MFDSVVALYCWKRCYFFTVIQSCSLFFTVWQGCCPVLILTGLAENECESCKCCANGRCIAMADNSLDHCPDGCIEGYYGYECKHACHAHCLKCTDIKTCIKCKVGYFGELCTACPTSCLICSSLHVCY